MGIIGMIVIGFIVGLVARAILPGTQALGFILTTVLGIIGSFVAGYVGQLMGLYQAGEGAGFLGSVIGAMILLFVVGKIKGDGNPKG
ncbi:MAG: GlsB/YeaQ/YmgE family stress response membrane protein [Ideonella sp.]